MNSKNFPRDTSLIFYKDLSFSNELKIIGKNLQIKVTRKGKSDTLIEDFTNLKVLVIAV